MKLKYILAIFSVLIGGFLTSAHNFVFIKPVQAVTKPDLIISKLYFKEEAKLNDVYGYFNISLKNIGQGDLHFANQNNLIEISCYDHNFASKSDRGEGQLGYSTTKLDLSSGESSPDEQVTSIQNASFLAKKGLQKLYCSLDDTNMIDESNENNNTFVLTYRLDGDDLQKKLTKANYIVSDLERSVVAREQARFQQANTLLSKRLSGKILLQVDENGEAWYVDKDSSKRFYLLNGDSAFAVLRAFAVGISNKDLAKIPVGVLSENDGPDTDGDKLPDTLEAAIGINMNKKDSDNDGFDDYAEVVNGYNPNGTGKVVSDIVLVSRLNNSLLLQVEGGGEAWYVHDGHRYYMPNPQAAYISMRRLSLGVSNNNLNQLDIGSLDGK